MLMAHFHNLPCNILMNEFYGTLFEFDTVFLFTLLGFHASMLKIFEALNTFTFLI